MAQTRTAKYSYRAQPTPSQRRWLAGALGAARTVYNDYIWQHERIYTGQQTTPLTPLDQYNNLPANRLWMKNYPQKIAQQATRQAQAAYKNYFASLKKGPRRGKPRYKRKKNGGSITWNGEGTLQTKRLNKKWAAVRLPKQGSWLKFRLSRELPSTPTGVTLKLSPAGEYTLSFTVAQEIAAPKTSGPAAGVDMGLIDLVTVVQDNGNRYKIKAPKHYRRAERKLARLSKTHSRKQSGSKNREKARRALARQHAHVAAQRLDQAHKIAARLTSENQAVSLEHLNLKALAKTKLSKSFVDAGLGQLAVCVEQAAAKRGARFTRVNPAYTSQNCSICGRNNGKKSLAVREWTCACGAQLDRDYNAAVNVLLAGGHSESLNGSGGSVRRGQLAGIAVADEGATSFAAYRRRCRRTRARSMARRGLLKAQAAA